MFRAHNLGFPRIGPHREMKQAVESYWKGALDREGLEEIGSELRRRAWAVQVEAGLDLVPVGDFSWYDHVLDHAAMVGAIPARFGAPGEGPVDLDTTFRMARGRAPVGRIPAGRDVPAAEMTKWFDTNYHYIVPELDAGMRFRLASERLFDHVREALALGVPAKPVVLGPLSFLWLGKVRDGGFDRLDLLPGLLSVYDQILARLGALGIEWVQVDEPILAVDLPDAWTCAFAPTYGRLAAIGPSILAATYFGGVGPNLATACALPVGGLHVDAVRGLGDLDAVARALPADRILSVGLVDGRNVWRTDLDVALERLAAVRARRGDSLWVAPSCSLLHVPVDLDGERKLDPEVRSWLAFAVQKVQEVVVLRRALADGSESVARELDESRRAHRSRATSPRTTRADVRTAVAAIDDAMVRRASPYPQRRVAQQARLRLPELPTTTIGSFPQTHEIRVARRDWKAGSLTDAEYREAMRREITNAVRFQEELGLDVLVHGEAERNDMVEHFGERLDGFVFSSNGWVQSYGSRCVKPPILFGDVHRPGPMTVDWSVFAQSLTPRPMKGMLTGPVTILQWSFVRDDLPRDQVTMQLALALREEVADLEAAGIGVVQIDEPAFREGLPLRAGDRAAYLDWAVRAFRVASSGVRDDTQIHTHMCYAEFNDVIESIAALDADVISIEASRSGMELLQAFQVFRYPNEIGPGLYDVHSPHVPTVGDLRDLIEKAALRIPRDRLWVNPDCGLKTRDWPETRAALVNLVAAAREARAG